MDTHQSTIAIKRTVLTSSFVVALILSFGPQAAAQQQPKLSTSYVNAARVSLQAIESDDSTTQSEDPETGRKLDIADDRVRSDEETSFAKILRQAYSRRVQDNNLLRAYGKLMEVENAVDDNDDVHVKWQKESSLSQLVDSEEGIMKREVACFKQLEQSLTQRSMENAPACSEWIQKSQIAPQPQASLIRQ
jgi:hypothetical protein